jgi:transcriptional regulator with XRE-family HTH domain
VASRPFLRLRFERYRRNLTQAQLGRKAGIPYSHICWMETGRMIPTEKELARLADVLLVSPPEILMREVAIADPESEPEPRVTADKVGV